MQVSFRILNLSASFHHNVTLRCQEVWLLQICKEYHEATPFKDFLLPLKSLLKKEYGKYSCIHKECVETAKKANCFWTLPLFGNTLVLELWLFKQKNHIFF